MDRPRLLRPAVFLDRDDTLIENRALPTEAFPHTFGDLFLPEYVRLLPGVLEACRSLKAAGYLLIIVTNQGGVARGGCTIQDVEATNERLLELLTPFDEPPRPTGVPRVMRAPLIDGVYSAPHHPEAVVEHLRVDHPWRKPGPGMVLSAAEDFGIDLSASWIIGDKERDRQAGINAGIAEKRALRVDTDAGADFVDLAAAARFILDTSRPVDAPTRSARAPRVVSATTVWLASSTGEPLADRAVRVIIESSARGIAERTGVEIIDLCTDERSVSATLATHRLAALGFMAELRRVTNAWHRSKRGGELWTTGDFEAPGDAFGGPET